MQEHLISKFGGTSVSSLESWENILQITQSHIRNGYQPVIVCSAKSGASDQLNQLIELALRDAHHALLDKFIQDHANLAADLNLDLKIISSSFTALTDWLSGIALLKHAPAKIHAQIMSLGELILTQLGHAFLNQNQVNVHWFDARLALLAETKNQSESLAYLGATCQASKNPELARRLFATGAHAIITQGFIAKNTQDETVLLGRGGSDTSAAIFAAILSAKLCEIWTDVPGIYSANPRDLPQARLLKQLNYDEAYEIAAMGAKVLHPPCLNPVKKSQIPMIVKYTRMPEHSGTRISAETDPKAPPIKSIQLKQKLSFISITNAQSNPDLDFQSKVLHLLEAHHCLSSLIASSEEDLILLIDHPRHLFSAEQIQSLITALEPFSTVQWVESCTMLSLIGQGIRSLLPQLQSSLALIGKNILYHMILAPNDLRLGFIMESTAALNIYPQLHAQLIEHNPQHYYYSKSWQEEFNPHPKESLTWWQSERENLLKIAQTESPCYVYHLETCIKSAETLIGLSAIDQIFYAIKANPHPDILMALMDLSIGFECASIFELEHLLNLNPALNPQRLLFSPNFAEKSEYLRALQLKCHLSIDSLYPLMHWPELFKNKSILLRVDPNFSAGHHQYVRAGGNQSKLGIPKEQLAEAAILASAHQIEIIGLHAHLGSGILAPEIWHKLATTLIAESKIFPHLKIINLGGGIGVREKIGQTSFDLPAFNQGLTEIQSQYPELKFWLEPGRFIVAESGVILAKVTQSKIKGEVQFIGIETGMNSLLRPMLYGAHHDIINLSRIEEKPDAFFQVVGPIAEAGDILGHDCLLPKNTRESDILLIANTGAYGHSMSSSYNLRPPAQEIII